MEFGYSNIILGNNTEFLIAQKSHIFLCRPLHSLQGQPYRFLKFWNSLRNQYFRNFLEEGSEIYDPKKDILSAPWNTVLTNGAENWEIHLKL